MAKYLSLNALMRHIRNTSTVVIRGSVDKRELGRIGYFHGFKGYRYVGSVDRRIPYSSFDEMLSVVRFDTHAKGILYPVLMELEMVMKNLALVQILEAADSSALPDIYARVMPGTKKGKKQKKLELIHKNSDVLLESYKRQNRIVKHYYDAPKEEVPLWALFEVMSLGHFGMFLQQLDEPVLIAIAGSWGLNCRDAALIPSLVFAVTELRNAVAHNGVIFDTRFKTARVRKQVANLLQREMEIPDHIQLQFATLTDYVALVVYLARCMGAKKRDLNPLITRYSELASSLRGNVPQNVTDAIIHTDHPQKMQYMKSWLSQH